MIEAFPDYVDRVHHMEKNQLYGLCINEQSLEASKNIVYARPYDLGIRKVPGLISIIKDKERFREVIRKEFGDMKFDVILGNPPYNRGMDLDFVNQSFDICNKYCLFITPAKWQTADSDQSVSSKTLNYGGFRSKIVPHISKVVFYPCCKDLFDIYQTDGITYFLLEKEKQFKECTVVNRCNDIEYFNGTEVRSIRERESLLNIGNEIINYLGTYNSFKFKPIAHNKRYEVWMNTKVSGYDWYATQSPRYVLSISRVLDNSKDMGYDGESKCVFESDSMQEIDSFLSWIYTRFTRFFLVPNISKLNNIQTNDCFRFVPSPPVDENGEYIWRFHYTDEKLYKFYGLDRPDAQTSAEVRYTDIIESVIKERK